jgi:hypothetical protein
MSDLLKTIFRLYFIFGEVYASIFYIVTAVQLLIVGDACGFMGWIFLLGPISMFASSLLWPLFLIECGFGGL